MNTAGVSSVSVRVYNHICSMSGQKLFSKLVFEKLHQIYKI